MSIIEICLSDVPIHIVTSDFVKGLIELSTDSDSAVLMNFPENVYCESLDIKSNGDLAKIVEADSYFGFSRETRVNILKNVNNFWLYTEEPIQLPKHGTILGDSINVLLRTYDSGIIGECMKKGLIELYMYCIESNNPKYKIEIDYNSDYNHSILLNAIVNKHYELFRMAYLHEFANISNSDRENFLIHAIEDCNMSLVELILKDELKIRQCTVQTAALHNLDINIDINSNTEKFICKMLPLLHNKGAPMCMHYAYWAVLAGCPRCLKYMMDVFYEERIEMIKQHNLLEGAVIGKSLECYKSIHNCLEEEDELPERLPILETVKRDSGDIFKYLVDLGVKVTPLCVEIAIQSKCTNLPPSYVKKLCKDTI